MPSKWKTTQSLVNGSYLNHSNVFLYAVDLTFGEITEGIILAKLSHPLSIYLPCYFVYRFTSLFAYNPEPFPEKRKTALYQIVESFGSAMESAYKFALANSEHRV